MPGSIQSLERAAAILRLLAGGKRRLSLADVSATLGLAKPTVHGIVRTLLQEGFVEQDPDTGRYFLGAELLRLGTSYLDVHELRARALVWADDLARQTGESVRIGVQHAGGVLVIHHVFRPDDSRQVLEIGGMLPLHATAWGKVLLANDPAALGDLDEEPKAYTRHTITDRNEIGSACDRVREQGWAAELEEYVEGLASIAALLVDPRHVPLGAIGIGGAIERLTTGSDLKPELIAAVRDASRAINRDIALTRQG